jgi:hypothetical protein
MTIVLDKAFSEEKFQAELARLQAEKARREAQMAEAAPLRKKSPAMANRKIVTTVPAAIPAPGTSTTPMATTKINRNGLSEPPRFLTGDEE